MIRRAAETVVFVALAVACVLGITALTPAALPRATRVDPPRDTKAVCLPASGEGGVLHLANARTVGKLGAEAGPVGDDLSVLTPGPVVVTGDGPVAGGVLSSEATARAWVPCATPSSEGSLVVPTSSGTRLMVVNPDSADAAVDLTLHGTSGEIEALGSRGITLGPHEARPVALSVLAGVDGPVGVDFATSRGRVVVVAVADGAQLDGTVAAAPAVEQVLAGVPAGADDVSVVLSNPTSERVTVDLEALGASAAYTPTGGAKLRLEPMATTVVPLVGALGGEPTSLRVSADHPVAASLVVTGPSKDRAVVASSQPATELTGFVPAGGVIQLSATRPATVQVTSGGATQSVNVPAGTTVTLPDPLAKAHRVQLTSDVPVTAAVVLVDAKGAAVAPLVSPTGSGSGPLEAVVDPSLS